MGADVGADIGVVFGLSYITMSASFFREILISVLNMANGGVGAEFGGYVPNPLLSFDKVD